MSAKIIPLTCPNCGANIETTEGKKIQYCPYCRTKLYFDTGDRNITIKKEYQNKTKLEEMRLQHEIDKENRERQDKAFRHFIIYIVICFGIFALLCLISLLRRGML